ncbi:MAG: RNA methyltransferase [Bacteroidetes bacterium]|nr:RNA methyltransferase [Bacteroidota bacterium]
MISKGQIKHISSLKLLKFRKATGEFVVEGEKMVHELIMSDYEINALYALPAWLEANQELIRQNQLNAEKISPKELERISSFKTPNQVLANAQIPARIDQEISFDDLILVLDDIRDPGNLGTIIRTADWFAIRTIVCSVNTVDLYNPKVLQSSMGSFMRVNVIYQDLKAFIQKARTEKVTVYGTFLNGMNIYDEKLAEKGLIIIGNESQGISPEIEKMIDKRINIPSYPQNLTNQAESLNASVATAIICAEFRRSFNP